MNTQTDMKIFFRLFAMMSMLAVGASCAASKYVATDLSTAEISHLAVFDPVSSVSLIERGNESQYNDSLTWLALAGLDHSLSIFESRFPSGLHRIEFAGALERQMVDEEICDLLTHANKHNVRELTIPPTINSLMKANGQRRALLVLHTGFTRNKGNYGPQVAASVGIAILTAVITLGMVSVITTPLKSNSTLHAIIVDAESDRVVFYNRVASEAEPCDWDVLSKQMERLFRKTLW